ncbi:lytic transglycosylase domain-containing protein [Nocardioides sp. CPCC 206347]|uniref:lytic transglycosylase domain-containing protein n=1 Tax=Nocardioides sp. CPCC 206347 TaxID=3406463 RepID=UPI003B428213
MSFRAARHRRPANGRVRRAAMLLPLGVVSVSWTVAIAGAGVVPVAGLGTSAAELPQVSMPDEAVESPASVSVGSAEVARPVRLVAVSNLTSELIPSPALSAYQRASTVMREADEKCGLAWPLLAAIGKVESNHGNANGNQLRDDGVAVPGIIGVALNGSRATARVSDTDGGRLDGDKAWDRAVGPMQFVPSTWAVVGVDGDSDSERNPQDVDDAALAAAVYLCSGDEDLSTTAGQRAAVLRYNHSLKYADLVLETADSYAVGGLVPTAAGRVVSPTGSAVRAAPARHGDARKSGARKSGVKAELPAPAPAKPAGPSGGSTAGEAPDAPAPIPGSPTAPLESLLTSTRGILACTLDGLGQLLKPGSPSTSGDCGAARTP